MAELHEDIVARSYALEGFLPVALGLERTTAGAAHCVILDADPLPVKMLADHLPPAPQTIHAIRPATPDRRIANKNEPGLRLNGRLCRMLHEADD